MWHAYVMHELDVQCLCADTRTSPSLPVFLSKLAIFPSPSAQIKDEMLMKGIKFGDDNNGRLSTVAVAATGAYQVSLCVCMQVYLSSVPMANCEFSVFQMFLPSNLPT